MKFLFALLVLISQSARSNECENSGLSPRAIVDKYVRFVEMGLGDQTIEISDLDRMLATSNVGIPLKSSARRLEKLFLRDAFKRLLPSIKDEEWRQIQARLETLKVQRMGKDNLISEAKEDTKPVFMFKALPFQISGKVLQKLVTSQNEIYLAVSGAKLTYRKLHSDMKLETPGKIAASGSNQVDLFETADGGVFGAFIVSDELFVHDLKKQKEIYHVKLPEIPHLTKVFELGQKARSGMVIYRPILFGADRLMVALVPNDGDICDYIPKLPTAIVDVASKEIHERYMPHEGLKFQRMDDGKAYAFGTGIIYEIFSQDVVFKDTTNDRNRSQPFDSKLVRLKSGEFRLLLKNPFQQSEIFDDMAQGPLTDVGSVSSDYLITKDKDGNTLLAFLRTDEKLTHWEVGVKYLDGPQTTHTQVLAPYGNGIAPALADVSMGLHGPVVKITNTDSVALKIDRIFLYEPEHNYITQISVRTQFLSTLIYDGAQNRLYTFATQSMSDKAPWALHLLWGFAE